MDFGTRALNQGNLTPRELEVVQGVCNAMTDKQIARLLAISANTVNIHIDHIHKKLGLETAILNKRVALVRIALARGLVCAEPHGRCE